MINFIFRFLQELGKVRNEMLADKWSHGTELNIQIIINKVASSFTLIDNGIGMTENDCNTHFSGSSAANNDEMNQFATVYQSAHKFADRVKIISKRQDSNPYVYESSIDKNPTNPALSRGTRVELHLMVSICY